MLPIVSQLCENVHFFFFFFNTLNLTQDITVAGQVLFLWAISLAQVFFFMSWNRVLLSCSDWAGTWSPPTSAYQILGLYPAIFGCYISLVTFNMEQSFYLLIILIFWRGCFHCLVKCSTLWICWFLCILFNLSFQPLYLL